MRHSALRAGSRADLAYLADTSTWVKSRQRRAPVWLRKHFDELLLTEQIVMCDVVKLELLHHEETSARFHARRMDLDALVHAPVDELACARALEVQAELARRGSARHRGAKLPDYLVAAAAELAGLTVLHYDADYTVITSVTHQPQEWIAPRGSL